MQGLSRQYVLNKYIPGEGRIEMNVTAKRQDDYSIDSVYFSMQRGNVVIKEDITFYILASRVYGHEYIDDWIGELLPAAMAADTFMEDADVFYEVKNQK